MNFKLNLTDTLSIATMSNKPIIIVEGKDDYQIYQNIAEIVNPNLQVYQVDEFENYKAGCTEVIKCLEILQPKFDERPDNINKVLGIIDRDSRPYRNDLPTHLNGLFVTKYYSIETYFATSENLRKLLGRITYNTVKDIDISTLDWLQTDFQNELNWLYLCSLEALKNECDRSYENLLKYSDKAGKISKTEYRQQFEPILQSKQTELENFAASKNISIADIKLIANGKWYLHWFVKYIEPKIKQLKEKCSKREITQCRSCKLRTDEELRTFEGCLYKTKYNTSKNQTTRLINDLQTMIDKAECADIIARFEQLG